jgi:hypothetical protein
MTRRRNRGHLLFGAIGLGAVACSSSTADPDAAEKSGSMAQAASAVDYLAPYSWKTRPDPGGVGSDPLNVILSANSDSSFGGLASMLRLFQWQFVQTGFDPNLDHGICISGQQAAVDGSTYAEQDFGMRPYACENVLTPGDPGGPDHNHLRGWDQTATGATFLAVSEEHVCTTYPGHCIDPTGFDQGREDLKVQILQLAKLFGYEITGNLGSTCPQVVTGNGCLNLRYDTRRAGTGSNGVAYDELVLVVTFKLPPPPPPANQPPTAPCGAGDNNGPNNGTCGPDGRDYYCYQGVWHLKDDCVAKGVACHVNPPGVADQCASPSGAPTAPCGAGDNNGSDNGTCGTDGRVYYCYQGVWHLKDDCAAKHVACHVNPPGVADQCAAPSGPPTAPCGAGNNNGPDNGTCGGDGRVYYCYQGVWHLKDDCAGRGVACIVEPPGVADRCAGACSSNASCRAGETCRNGACTCGGPLCGATCCGPDAWCGTGNRCCTGCGIGCPC